MRTLGSVAGFCVLAAASGCDGDAPAEPVVDFRPPPVAVEPGALFRGTFSPDGMEFYWFTKVNPDEEAYRVYRAERVGAGWSEPALLALGDSSASSMYPAVSPDGRLLVFTSYRAVDGVTGNANLWVARRDGAGWAEPTLLLDASTLENYDAAPWFGPDGELRFSSTSPDWSETWKRSAPRSGESFGPWAEDAFWDGLAWPRETHHFWSGVLNRAGTIAVLELSARRPEGSLGDADLWISRRVDGEWTAPEPLGSDVNTDGVENFPSFAPDDATLLFVRDFSAFDMVDVGGVG